LIGFAKLQIGPRGFIDCGTGNPFISLDRCNPRNSVGYFHFAYQSDEGAATKDAHCTLCMLHIFSAHGPLLIQ
jgi:hypothetical protein